MNEKIKVIQIFLIDLIPIIYKITNITLRNLHIKVSNIRNHLL